MPRRDRRQSGLLCHGKRRLHHSEATNRNPFRPEVPGQYYRRWSTDRRWFRSATGSSPIPRDRSRSSSSLHIRIQALRRRAGNCPNRFSRIENHRRRRSVSPGNNNRSELNNVTRAPLTGLPLIESGRHGHFPGLARAEPIIRRNGHLPRKFGIHPHRPT